MLKAWAMRCSPPAPESVSHEVVDDEADLDEGVAVRLGHPVHHVAHQVLQRVGRAVLLKGELANEATALSDVLAGDSSTHAVVELLEPGDGEELVHVDAVVEEEPHEVHPVALQRLLRRLLQRATRPLLACNCREGGRSVQCDMALNLCL